MSRDKEFKSRSSSFRGGRALFLADGQAWSFPRPAASLFDHDAVDRDSTYSGLLQAIMEADDAYERSLAELALAIFLLSLNYDLASEEYQELLAFEPGSEELYSWQDGLREISTKHLDSFLRTLHVDTAETVSKVGEERPLRLIAKWLYRFRSLSPIRR